MTKVVVSMGISMRGALTGIAAAALGFGGLWLPASSAQAEETIPRVEMSVYSNWEAPVPVRDGFMQCLGLTYEVGNPATLWDAMQLAEAPNPAVFLNVPEGLYPYQSLSVYTPGTGWSCSPLTPMAPEQLWGYQNMTDGSTGSHMFGYSNVPIANNPDGGTVQIHVLNKNEVIEVNKSCADGTKDCGVERLFVAVNSTGAGRFTATAGWITSWVTDSSGYAINIDVPSGWLMAVYEYLPPGEASDLVSAHGDQDGGTDVIVLDAATIANIQSHPRLHRYDVANLSVLEPGGLLVGYATASQYGGNPQKPYGGFANFVNGGTQSSPPPSSPSSTSPSSPTSTPPSSPSESPSTSPSTSLTSSPSTSPSSTPTPSPTPAPTPSPSPTPTPSPTPSPVPVSSVALATTGPTSASQSALASAPGTGGTYAGLDLMAPVGSTGAQVTVPLSRTGANVSFIVILAVVLLAAGIFVHQAARRQR